MRDRHEKPNKRRRIREFNRRRSEHVLERTFKNKFVLGAQFRSFCSSSNLAEQSTFNTYSHFLPHDLGITVESTDLSSYPQLLESDFLQQCAQFCAQ